MNFLKRLQEFSDYCYDANVDNVGFAMSIVLKDKARHKEIIAKAQTINNRAMIQLSKDIIAVEVPNDARDILLIHGNTRLAYFRPNYARIDLSCKAEYLMGVTPLSEEQWKEVVDSKQIGQMTEPRYRDHQYGEFIVYGLKTATESGLSLLESKGLDINKKYAIIKIEK